MRPSETLSPPQRKESEPDRLDGEETGTLRRRRAEANGRVSPGRYEMRCPLCQAARPSTKKRCLIDAHLPKLVA